MCSAYIYIYIVGDGVPANMCVCVYMLGVSCGRRHVFIHLFRSLPYCDASLSITERVSDLVGRLHLVEQISLIGPNTSKGFTLCPTFTPTPGEEGSTVGIARVGLPTWRWLTETNSGAGAHCISKTKCATVFVGPMGMAASFNRSSWRLKGSVTATETRGFVNANIQKHNDNPALSGFGALPLFLPLSRK